MKQLLMGMTLLLAAGAASAAERFTCQYVTKIKAVNLSGKTPKAEVSTIKERYAFYVDTAGKASYVNLETGSKDDITAERFGAGWHFSGWISARARVLGGPNIWRYCWSPGA